MRGNASIAISPAHLANEVREGCVADPGGRRVGRRLEPIMTADRDEAGATSQALIGRADKADEACGLDVATR